MNEIVSIGVQTALVPALKQCHVAGDHPQGLLQVVRSYVGELLKVGIGALEFIMGPLQLGHQQAGSDRPGDLVSDQA